METVCMAKSGPKTNQSERTDLPQDYPSISIDLLYSWRFSRHSAPIHWLVHGHMTSNNETVSRQMPWAGSIAKTMTSNGKQFTQGYPRNVDRCCTWSLESQRGNIEILGKQTSLFPSGPVIKCLLFNNLDYSSLFQARFFDCPYWPRAWNRLRLFHHNRPAHD